MDYSEDSDGQGLDAFEDCSFADGAWYRTNCSFHHVRLGVEMDWTSQMIDGATFQWPSPGMRAMRADDLLAIRRRLEMARRALEAALDGVEPELLDIDLDLDHRAVALAETYIGARMGGPSAPGGAAAQAFQSGANLPIKRL